MSRGKEPCGADILRKLLDLLAEQEHVKITYRLENEKQCVNYAENPLAIHVAPTRMARNPYSYATAVGEKSTRATTLGTSKTRCTAKSV